MGIGMLETGRGEENDGSNVYEITEQARSDGSPGRKWKTSRVPAHLKDSPKPSAFPCIHEWKAAVCVSGSG